MAPRTVQGHDVGTRDEALASGKADAAIPPRAEARLQRRIKRLEKQLETEGPDGARGVSGLVRAPAERSRSGTRTDRR